MWSSRHVIPAFSNGKLKVDPSHLIIAETTSTFLLRSMDTDMGSIQAAKKALRKSITAKLERLSSVEIEQQC